MLILSREQNPVVKARAAKLQMEVLHHIRDKFPALDEWRIANGLEWAEIGYVGNDMNNLDLKACGMSFAPADAHPDICAISAMVLKKSGGNGALRELSEFLIHNKLVG